MTLEGEHQIEPEACHYSCHSTSLRDLPTDQQVSLEIRGNATGTWQSVEAEPIGNLAYRADLAVEPGAGW